MKKNLIMLNVPLNEFHDKCSMPNTATEHALVVFCFKHSLLTLTSAPLKIKSIFLWMYAGQPSISSIFLYGFKLCTIFKVRKIQLNHGPTWTHGSLLLSLYLHFYNSNEKYFFHLRIMTNKHTHKVLFL